MMKVFKVGLHKFIEVSFFNVLSHSSGFYFSVDFSLKGDHAPKFGICLIISNINIFEFTLYDSRHEDVQT